MSFCLAPLQISSAAPSHPKDKAEGQALAAELRNQAPIENTEFTGLLKIRDSNGKRTEIPIRLQTIIGDKFWKAVYQAEPSAKRAAEKFIVVHRENSPNQYFAARGTNDNSTLPEAVPSSQPHTSFAGSDFWLADLGLEFLHWPEQRLVKSEMRRGRPCKVLESMNPQPAIEGYSRVLSWIDAESNGLLRAEAYDKDKRLFKEFTVGSFKRVKGRWELQDIEIRNERTDSRTRLEFDLKSR